MIQTQDVLDAIRDEELNAALRDWELPQLNEAAGIDARWLQALVCVRFADLLAQLTTGQRLKALSVEDRAWLRGQVEQLVEDAVQRFEVPAGDAEYRQEDEPEYARESVTGEGRY